MRKLLTIIGLSILLAVGCAATGKVKPPQPEEHFMLPSKDKMVSFKFNADKYTLIIHNDTRFRLKVALGVREQDFNWTADIPPLGKVFFLNVKPNKYVLAWAAVNPDVQLYGASIFDLVESEMDKLYQQRKEALRDGADLIPFMFFRIQERAGKGKDYARDKI